MMKPTCVSNKTNVKYTIIENISQFQFALKSLDEIDMSWINGYKTLNFPADIKAKLNNPNELRIILVPYFIKYNGCPAIGTLLNENPFMSYKIDKINFDDAFCDEKTELTKIGIIDNIDDRINSIRYWYMTYLKFGFDMLKSESENLSLTKIKNGEIRKKIVDYIIKYRI